MEPASDEEPAAEKEPATRKRERASEEESVGQEPAGEKKAHTVLDATDERVVRNVTDFGNGRGELTWHSETGPPVSRGDSITVRPRDEVIRMVVVACQPIWILGERSGYWQVIWEYLRT
jgi:hypothetical protein